MRKNVFIMLRRLYVAALTAVMATLAVAAQTSDAGGNGRSSECHPSSLGNGRVVTDEDKVYTTGGDDRIAQLEK